MKNFFLILAFFCLNKISAQSWLNENQYIQQFAPFAVEEMEKYKIPASITLAQGLLETGGGQSRLAVQGNNHFGIKCKQEWTGPSMTHTDDAPNECFRVYENPKKSYEDHSIFLATRKHYAPLFTLDIKDYKAWAYGLKKAGYATNPRYPTILITKIEKYRLYEFDNTDSKEVYATILKLYPDLQNDKVFMAKLNQDEKTTEVFASNPPKITPKEPKKEIEEKTEAELLSTILVRNHPNGDRKFIIVPAKTQLHFIAEKFGINVSKLMKWNDLTSEGLNKNDIIFLESKAGSGNIETYRAAVDESMHDIAQKFAIKLSKLYSRNRMEEGSQPLAGQLIYLQGKKPRS